MVFLSIVTSVGLSLELISGRLSVATGTCAMGEQSLNPRCSEQLLTHSRCSINVCLVNKAANLPIGHNDTAYKVIWDSFHLWILEESLIIMQAHLSLTLCYGCCSCSSRSVSHYLIRYSSLTSHCSCLFNLGILPAPDNTFIFDTLTSYRCPKNK